MTVEQYNMGRAWAEGLRQLPSLRTRERWNQEEIFDLSVWARVDVDNGLATHSRLRQLEFDDVVECGFSGCAVGWLPFLLEGDFVWVNVDARDRYIPDDTEWRAPDEEGERFGLGVRRRGEEDDRFDAHRTVAVWFGVTEEEARRIIYDSYYPQARLEDEEGRRVMCGRVTPEAVADRIDEILDGYESLLKTKEEKEVSTC